MDKLFIENIRDITGDDSELRASLQNFGWVKEFPALADEAGMILVGHRRLKIAKELKIEPVIKTLELGKGEAADAERLKLALVSNLGTKLMTREDRKRIAEHLCGKEWTVQRIANALNVSKYTISKDLENVSSPNNQKHAKTATNPKGAGRHRGSKAKSKPRAKVTDEHETKIVALADGGMTHPEISAETGIHPRVVGRLLQDEQIRRDAQAIIDPSTLSMSAQQKLEAAVRQHKHKLDLEFEPRVLAGIKKRIDEIVLPHWKKQIDRASELYKRRRGLMDKNTFNIIRRALHPDSRNSISDQKLGEAFDTFMGLEKYLLDETQSPTEWPPLPNSWAEWEAAKRKATEERRSKRRSNSNISPRG